MKKKKTEPKRFIIILKVNSWDFWLSHSKYQPDKNWPSPEISESWTAKCTVLYSNCQKYKAGDDFEVHIGTNYEYMVYNLLKDKRFIDRTRPDNKYASVSYDEYMKQLEDNSKKIVGYIRDNFLHSGSPIEITNRIASCPDKCAYIDIMAYREKRQRIMLIQSIEFTSKINLEEYTG